MRTPATAVLALTLILAATLTGCASSDSAAVSTTDSATLSATVPGGTTPSSATPGPSTPGPSTPGPAAVALTVSSGYDALGAAKVGQPAALFAEALGRIVAPLASGQTDSCVQRTISGMPGVTLMVVDGADSAVARVDVTDRRIRTADGLGVGSTVAQVKAAHPGAVTASPHKYIDGAFYLTLTGAGHSLLFETNARSVVTTFRFGDADPVSWVEGCA